MHSHDACDGNPYVDGGVNEPCLQSFRHALCRTRVDVVFLTEHAGLMAQGSFERVMQLRDGDEPVTEAGALVGHRIGCADGHRVLLLPGAENELMPLALTRHPDTGAGTLDDAYHTDDAAGVARFRAAGALVAVPHVEQRSLAHLMELSPDLVEIYNVHANVDPRIAGPYLGLDVGAALLDLGRFGSAWNNLEPDLVLLTFFAENQNDLSKWAALLAAGRRIPGVAASDAHENTFRSVMPDGERGDSYRRMFRFFSNELLVEGELTRAGALAALARGRSFVAFEAFGTPEGFEYVARRSDGSVVDMGGQVPREGTVLRAVAPRVHGLDPALPLPAVRVRLLRADAAMGWVEVAGGMDAVEHSPTTPGAYRAEVRIVPNHARPYLPRMERLVREYPWVYGNPIYVE